MKSILFLLDFIFALALILNSCISCEQLSTVFVLETSDSSTNNNENYSGSAPSIVTQPKPQSQSAKQQPEDQNTRIITDDSSSNSPSSTQKPHAHQKSDSPVVVLKQHPTNSSASNHHDHQVHQNHQHQQQHQNQNQKQHQHQNHQQHQHSTTSEQSNHHLAHHGEEEHHQVPTVRRIEEESQLNEQKLASKIVKHQPTNNHNKQKAPSTTTTTTEAQYVPKTEERLLISITSSDDEDENYKPPPKQQVSSGSISLSEELRPVPIQQQQQQHSHHKRKPSITISIEDSSLKQNGVISSSSGSPAVILRPSENGQSIVISTIETSSGNTGNKYVGQNSKPAIAIVSSATEPPYREPVAISGSNHQGQYTSTSTRRPALVTDYNPVASNVQSNRPIVSTLIDSQRPSNQVTEERPQRPIVVQPSEDTIYDQQQQRPTSRPVNKPIQDSTGYNPTNENTEQSDDNSQPTRPTNQQEQTPKYPLNEKNCGVVHETRIVGGDEANPDDFLWMAAIIKTTPKDGDAKPFCGGSLITRRHILTAAHCLDGLAPRDVLVRLGSYDFDDSTASSLSVDYAIDQFRVHGQYSKKTHVADIAIMRIKTPLSTSDNYKTVCMPQPRRSYVGVLGK